MVGAVESLATGTKNEKVISLPSISSGALPKTWAIAELITMPFSLPSESNVPIKGLTPPNFKKEAFEPSVIKSAERPSM